MDYLAQYGLEDKTWSEVKNQLIGITPMMEFCRMNYVKDYAPNTRVTFRRQTMQQFIEAGISLFNPDNQHEIEPKALN
ncbi:hypothetical protein [Paenibacillus pinisoli]|uniref:hypothetical protein n=1 Tax=Paenibacillus pinisoli TaxID=1276110 RepID=UPI001A9E93DA|nr:hypothetical protein [Paenibacillus pinisoli]